MMAVDLKDLKELAVAAADVSIVETDTGGAFRTQMDGDIWGRFVSAASPETILELIARVEAAEGERDVLSEALDSVCRERDEAYDELEEDKAILKDIDEITAANAELASWSKAKDEKLHDLRSALEQAKAREVELRRALEKIASTPLASEQVLELSDADDEPGLGDWRRGENHGIERCASLAREALRNAVTAMGGDDA